MSNPADRSRRKFVADVSLAAAGLTIVPRHVLGRGFEAPSDTLNVASVGVGGMGRSNMINLASQNIVALCDVDWGYADRGFAQLAGEIASLQKRVDENMVEFRPPASARNQGDAPVQKRPMTALERSRTTAQIEHIKRVKDVHLARATRYQDYREMLEKQKDIDAVVVATPDHLHAGIALAAMDLGKHVYVQKPLTWSIAEARQLARRAKETKLATQMGNQGHSFDEARMAIEYVWAGAIGDVREIHIWTNRPLGYWPQGVPRPEPLKTPPDKLRWNGPGVNERLAAALAGSYPVPSGLAWDLFLGPATVETVSTPFNGVCHPHATTTFYEFPARGDKPPVKLTWYDGGLLPPKPAELGEEELNKGGGALLVGSKGKLMHDTYGYKPRLLPESLHDSFGTPPQKLPRIPNESHEMNWADAAKGKTEPSCPFEYAAKLTEVMLLGVVSLRAGKKLLYDGENMRVTNDPAANDFLRRDARPGWKSDVA